MSLSTEDQIKEVEAFFKFTVKSLAGRKDVHKNVNEIKSTILNEYDKLKGKLDSDLRSTLEKRDSYLRKAFQMLTETEDICNEVDSEDENMNVREYIDEIEEGGVISDDDFEYIGGDLEDEVSSTDCSSNHTNSGPDESDFESTSNEDSSPSSNEDCCNGSNKVAGLRSLNGDSNSTLNNQLPRENLKNALQEKIRQFEEKRGKYKMTEEAKKKILEKRKRKHEGNKKLVKKQRMEKKKKEIK